MDDRIRLLGIAPYEEMRTLMQEMAEAHEGIDLTAFVGDLQHHLPRRHSVSAAGGPGPAGH